MIAASSASTRRQSQRPYNRNREKRKELDILSHHISPLIWTRICAPAATAHGAEQQHSDGAWILCFLKILKKVP
jgi:hypothetical protein